jgi:transposase
MWSSFMATPLKFIVMLSQITASPKLFIGLDIHKKSWSVHFRTDISDHRGFTMPPVSDKLRQYVNQHFGDHEVYITYESGCCGFGAARLFTAYGWSVTIVNAADIPRIQKHQFQKSDRIDSRLLCRHLQQGQLKAIYIPSVEQDELRSLVRHRNSVVKQLRQVKLQIKSMLLYHGITIPEQYDNPNWSHAFLQWLYQLQWQYQPAVITISSKLTILKTLHSEYLRSANELRKYCRQHHKKDYYLLKSIPGIGGYLASAVLAELGDLRRFKNEKYLSSYIGMVPAIRNSGATERNTGITPRSKTLLRSYLIEAAWVAIRRDPEMQAYYRKHMGNNIKNIIVKVAHKLVTRMLSVIKHETPYQVNHYLSPTLKPVKKTRGRSQNMGSELQSSMGRRVTSQSM